jgi:hypothetical protein
LRQIPCAGQVGNTASHAGNLLPTAENFETSQGILHPLYGIASDAHIRGRFIELDSNFESIAADARLVHSQTKDM